METHENKPPRSALESILCRLSISSSAWDTTGQVERVEITDTEFAGMLAGMPVRDGDSQARELAEHIAWAHLGHPHAMARLVDHLDTWSRQRVLFRYPALEVTGHKSRRVAEVVAFRHIYREPATIEAMRQAMQVSARKWPLWRDWVGDLSVRVSDAADEMGRHLRYQLSLSA